MRTSAERAASLARIARIKADLVKLAEWKRAGAKRDHDALLEERRLLADFVSGGQTFDPRLGRAALRTARHVDARIVQSEAEIAAIEEQLRLLVQQSKAVAELAETVRRTARRDDEARALESTMNAWLARASLP